MSEQPELDDVEIIDPNDLPDDLEDGFDPCEEGENLDELVGVFAFGTTTRHVMATWLPAAFRKWGVKYRLVAGWETRGRPLSAGYFDPNALLTHHTGSTSSATNPRPSLKTLIEGRTGLKGPLCQIATDYNGVTDIVAAGRANHAGSARAAMGNPAGDGNAMYLGNEVQTNGTQKMPQVQYDAIVLVSAAILDHFGYTNANKLGLHNTTSTSGKWDLGAGTGTFGVPYSITRFRADVTARLKAGPPDAGPRTTLRPGDRGDDVKALQLLLNATGATLDADGSYGPATEAAVRTFQSASGLPVDGIAGSQTRAALTATPALKEDAMPLLTDKVTVRNPDGTTEEIPYSWLLNRMNYAYNATIRLETGLAKLEALLTTAAAGGSTLTPEAAERIYREELAKRLDELKFVDAGDTQ